MWFSSATRQAQWFLIWAKTQKGQPERHLFKSSTGTAIYRVHNRGPSVVTINDDTKLERGETIDIRHDHIHVALADGETAVASGWYEFIDGKTES